MPFHREYSAIFFLSLFLSFHKFKLSTRLTARSHISTDIMADNNRNFYSTRFIFRLYPLWIILLSCQLKYSKLHMQSQSPYWYVIFLSPQSFLSFYSLNKSLCLVWDEMIKWKNIRWLLYSLELIIPSSFRLFVIQG